MLIQGDLRVLVASFRLEHDEGLARVGALVHYLDIGGIPVVEAPGFASIWPGCPDPARGR